MGGSEYSIPITHFRGERRQKERRGIHLPTYMPTLTSGVARTGLVEVRLVDFNTPFRQLFLRNCMHLVHPCGFPRLRLEQYTTNML